MASFDIQSKEAVHLEIKGYDGLAETSLFHGKLAAETMQHIATSYTGLALLSFEHGQTYPVIIGTHSFVLTISTPNTPPSFSGSSENEYFFARLGGTKTEGSQCEFADLMIEAKQLLDSTGSIRTVAELQTMKDKFHTFVRSNCKSLYHSDMLRRLIAQYFMMHEYVDYHVPGTPATDIKMQYQNAVMDGVRNWLEILKPDIPQNEVLNYCVSLYYDRSMVTLASKIIENFRATAYCPGEERPTPVFPPDLTVIDAKGNKRILRQLSSNTTIAVVSDDCPVSKVDTVMQARRLAQQAGKTMVVAPLQPLSENHLSMQKMVSGGNMLFVDDEKWRKENMPQQMKLPRFIRVEGNTGRKS
ncbi:hypothetical protein [Desulfopila aestuarii]|nr:hypothetical protein [Desulfopila aestuarii]